MMSHHCVVAVWSASAVLVGPLVPLSQAADLSDEAPASLSVNTAASGEGPVSFFEDNDAEVVDLDSLWADIGYDYDEGAGGMLLAAGVSLQLVEGEATIGEAAYVSAAVHDGMQSYIDLEAFPQWQVIRSAVSAGSVELADGAWRPVVMGEIEVWHPEMGFETATIASPMFTTRTVVQAVEVAGYLATRMSMAPTCSGFGGTSTDPPDLSQDRACATRYRNCAGGCEETFRWAVAFATGGLLVSSYSCVGMVFFFPLCMAVWLALFALAIAAAESAHASCMSICRFALDICNRGN